MKRIAKQFAHTSHAYKSVCKQGRSEQNRRGGVVGLIVRELIKQRQQSKLELVPPDLITQL